MNSSLYLKFFCSAIAIIEKKTLDSSPGGGKWKDFSPNLRTPSVKWSLVDINACGFDELLTIDRPILLSLTGFINLPISWWTPNFAFCRYVAKKVRIIKISVLIEF